jgi:hypothetical protein
MPGIQRGIGTNRCGRSLGLGAAATMGGIPWALAPKRRDAEYASRSGLATAALPLPSSGPIIIVIVGPLPARIGRDQEPHH